MHPGTLREVKMFRDVVIYEFSWLLTEVYY